MRANSTDPTKLAATILCKRKTYDGSDIDASKNTIENELKTHLTRFEQQLNFFKRSAIGKLKDTQIQGLAEADMDSYIKITMENVRNIALMIFMELIREHWTFSAYDELITCCERFLEMISYERLPNFEKDILRYRLNFQARKKLAQLPRAYIPLVAPILLHNAPPQTDADLKHLALKQLNENILCMKSIFPNTYKLKAFSDLDEAAVKSITTIWKFYFRQEQIEVLVREINEIAGSRIEKYIEKVDTEVQSSLHHY